MIHSLSLFRWIALCLRVTIVVAAVLASASPAIAEGVGSAASNNQPWVKFIPVPKTQVFFFVWNTRVYDFADYSDPKLSAQRIASASVALSHRQSTGMPSQE